MRILIFVMALIFSLSAFANDKTNIPVLCYHNLNPTKPGSMNMTPNKFESQIKWILDNGFKIVPLKEVVEYLKGSRTTLPEKSVVITFDDGWKSAYTYLFPIVKKYHIPVTLFIYPETISTGKNAMTWDELDEMQKSGLFDVQSHTYSHPNFKQEKRHLSSQAFEKFVVTELAKSKKILEEKLGHKMTTLAWPFGIYDDYLEQEAKNAGYEMAFSIDARAANRSDPSMAQPRFMIVNGLSTKRFISIINTANAK